jgi:iron complex outermembrane receptor protein
MQKTPLNAGLSPESIIVHRSASTARFSHLGLIASASSISLLAAFPAHAQGAPDAQPHADETEAVGESGADEQSNEIIVTAQKRAENVQDVPLTVSVASGELLKSRVIFDSSQLPNIAPSLQLQGVNNVAGAVNFSIRGIGTVSYAPTVESSVSVVIDGIAMGKPTLGILQFFDIDHVEVLSGPQGMLFGKNASAGVVSITTNRPALNEYSAMTHLSYGSHNEAVGQAVVNVPIGDTSAIRVAGFGTHRDGFFNYKSTTDQSTLAQREYGVRMKYLWEPNDSFDLYVSGDITHENGTGPGGLSYFKAAPGGVIEEALAADGIVAGSENTAIGSGPDFFAHFTLRGIQAEANLDIGDHTVTNLIGYRKFTQSSGNDIDGTSADIFDTNTQDQDHQQFSEELRLTSPSGGALEYVAGLYYFDGRYKNRQYQLANLLMTDFPPGVIAFIGSDNSQVADLESVAAYAQSTLRISDVLRLSAGARITHDKVSSTSLNLETPTLAAFDPPGGGTERTKNTNISYRIGAQYDIARDVMVYASYARGYKGPAFNSQFNSGPVIRPEIPVAVELGIKSQLFDRSLILNAAIFRQTFHDYQAQTYDAIRQTFLVANAGSVVSQGAEFSARFAPRSVPGLTMGVNGTYLDAYYRRFPGNPCYAAQTEAEGCELGTGTTDASGNALAGAARWTVTSDARFESPMTNRVSAFIAGDFYYRSKVNFSPTADPNTIQNGFIRLGANFGIADIDDHWKLYVFGRNLTDERVRTNIIGLSFFDDAALGGDYIQFFGPDSFRTVGVGLDLRF